MTARTQDHDRFECGHCGSHDLLIPESPSDDSIIVCGFCRRELSTWSAARDRLNRLAFRVDGRSDGRRVRLTSI